MRALAVLGGTFDPVHCGHVRIAIEVRERLALDEVRLMPAPTPRLRAAPQASTAQRLEMLDAAVTGLPAIGVDTVELDTNRDGEATRSVDTLRALRRAHPHDSIGFILGADAFARLDEWHEFETLPTLAHLIVVERPGSTLPTRGPVAAMLRERGAPDLGTVRRETCGFVFEVDAPHLDISASQLRAYISSGRSIDCLTPRAVQKVIEREQTYQHAT